MSKFYMSVCFWRASISHKHNFLNRQVIVIQHRNSCKLMQIICWKLQMFITFQHSFMINKLQHAQRQMHLSPCFYNVVIFVKAEATESVTNMQMLVWLRGSWTLPSSCGPQRNNTPGGVWVIIATHRESDLNISALNRRGEGVTFPKLVQTLVK